MGADLASTLIMLCEPLGVWGLLGVCEPLGMRGLLGVWSLLGV